MKSSVDHLVSTIEKKYPVFSPSIKRNIAARPDLFLALAGRSLDWAVNAVGPGVIELIADGYVHFVNDVNREQLAYCKSGAYKNKSYAEVYKSVYDNDSFMSYYHWGVFATLFLWPHHLQLYGFFRDRFLAEYVPNSGNVLDLGSGSGIWSILTADHLSNVTVHGLDISKTSLEVSTSLAKAAKVDDRVTFEIGDALQHLGSETYNAGISGFLMEHLECPSDLIKNFHRNLLRGAPLFITAAITAAEVDHIFEFKNEGQVVGMLENNGFRILEMFSAAPPADERLRFLPRSVGIIACKRLNSEW